MSVEDAYEHLKKSMNMAMRAFEALGDATKDAKTRQRAEECAALADAALKNAARLAGEP